MADIDVSLSDGLALQDTAQVSVYPRYALMSIEDYELITGKTVPATKRARIEMLIKVCSKLMEDFCNRPLRYRTFDYDPTSMDYDPDFSIFDGPTRETFWFPTNPVESVESFLVNGEAIAPATDYADLGGYHLYPREGKLIYYGGFGPGYTTDVSGNGLGYPRNVQVRWSGGYKDDSAEMVELRFLCARYITLIMSAPSNPLLQSEKIGNYSYSMLQGAALSALRAMSPDIFQPLARFRKVAFA